jgi:hypothetical protein
MTNEQLNKLVSLAEKKLEAETTEVVQMWRLLKELSNEILLGAGFSDREVKAMHTKFNDAGRRSAPWKAFSQKVPGRPQDGKDGNRMNRWLFDPTHKQYATEKDATLVQIRYYLQALSMISAPTLPIPRLKTAFQWLAGHVVEPGAYEDPIQLIPIDLIPSLKEPRSINSGHLVPLDRGGRHVPENAFLMLHRSNQMQGNMSVKELIELMSQIVQRHSTRVIKGTTLGQ